MTKQKMAFQAEIKQLLDLMVHSLYSHKEIFLRELISNAADATEKFRTELMTNEAMRADQPESPAIYIETDKAKRTVTIRDNGIGMNRDDVINNLGTIARSGTKEFINALSKDAAKDSQLIGQFGVGFYSGYMVADTITVETRKAGLPDNQAVRWSSSADGEFSVEDITQSEVGTKIILHLKKEADEFLDPHRLKNIVHTYSEHIAVPIFLKMPVSDKSEDGEAKDVTPADAFEQVNQAKALWLKSKSEIEDKDYQEFYKHIAHDFEDPLAWTHNKVEGKLEYSSLLYIPAHQPFDLFQREMRRGLKLYVNRVFIMDDAEQFLPFYMRFVRGVLDCNDLPLNVSREILQNNPLVEKIRKALVNRVLSTLETMAKNDAEQYAKFWNTFGTVLKEGPAEDTSNRERIAKLLRFATTHTNTAEQTVSLEDYIGRMKKGQDKIYFITAASFNAAQHSPHLEVFREKEIEVLLLDEHVDEWLMSHLYEFEGKQFENVTKGDLDLGELEDEKTKEAKKADEEAHKDLVEKVQKALEDHVSEVRITHRLTSSPSCVVVGANEITGPMRRMLEATGQTLPESKPIFELNPQHDLIQRLSQESDDTAFKEWAHLLFEQAVLAEGGQLKDPAAFVNRMNQFLMK